MTRGRSRRVLVALGVLGCALLAPTVVRGEVLVLNSLQDTTLYEDSEGRRSNGSGSNIFVGLNAGSTGEVLKRRGLLRFDVAGSVPAGSTIHCATLTLNLSRTSSGAQLIDLHRVLSDWGEGTSDASLNEGQGAPAAPGDATWMHTFYDSSRWSRPGGDFIETASATQTVDSPGFYSWTSPALVGEVQSWLDQPSSDFGWLLMGPEHGSRTSKRFDSKENVAASNRPRLTVVFTPPGIGDACCFADGTCGVSTPAECEALSGTIQGAGTTCVPNPCDAPPTGACCFDDAPCAEQTASACCAAAGLYQGDGTSCSDHCRPVLEPFVDALSIPAVARPVAGLPGGEASYRIAMREFQHRFHRDLPPSTVWGFGGGTTGGTIPGPTIEAARHHPVTVTWVNDLRDSSGNPRSEHYLEVDTCPHGAEDPSPRSVVHVHGAHVPPESDGYPEDTLLPGQQDVYDYPNGQLPATLWYHDHALGITRLNVYMGLAGFYLLRDEAEHALGLPGGEFEVPLVIQDRRFNLDGSLQYPPEWHDHFFGDTITVNGKAWPTHAVKRGKYRFRILNASNSRAYQLYFGFYPFHQIGTDGGLLPAPVLVEAVTLLPGERGDVVFDFAGFRPGSELVLYNFAPAPFPEGGLETGTPTHLVMKFVVLDEAGHTAPLPGSLRPLERLSEESATVSRDFQLQMGEDHCAGSAWLINGLRWEDITEHPELGTVEVWRYINRSGVTHPMHPHLVQAQVLDRQPFEIVDGAIVPTGTRVPPLPNEAGWKDTVQAPPFEITRIIARFDGFTGRYAHHCHILEHEDNEMMRQFQTVSCGNGASEPGEACDDGNLGRGDGCSPSCGPEDFLELFGFARAGEVSVSIAGVSIVANTIAGQEAAEVVSSLVDAINAHPTLQATGVYGVARGSVLVTNGTILHVVIADPGLSDHNRPPAAIAGADRSVECTSPAGATVTLDGSDSFDPDSRPGTHDDIVSFEWFVDFGLPSEASLGAAERLDVPLPQGSHVITLRATDRVGDRATDETSVTVVDTTPPEIAVETVPRTLWPPNHAMVDVEARVVARDACGPASVVLASVSSNEADGARRGGHAGTDDDVQGAELSTPDYGFKLRAERSGKETTRVYRVTYTAADDSGNVGSASAVVVVPHDGGRR